MDRDAILNALPALKAELGGDLYYDNSTRIQYATDASAYRELPMAVARPRNKDDIKKLIRFAVKNKTSLIPRGAGTSLAGQVVGSGIVVDVSKYLNRIIEISPKEGWARVEPGVVLEELNIALEPHGLFFGPETSTANRCVISGMVGNNSCGVHSLLYGSTREHTLELHTILSDGSEVVFGPLTKQEFAEKLCGDTLENILYRNINGILSDPENREEIRKEYPDPKIKRRNTGYAIDLLLETEPFFGNTRPFNFCKLLTGSEGTLAFTTGIKLHLVPLPPAVKGLVCVHLDKLHHAFQANLIALKHNPGAVELMDSVILEQTKDNIEQSKNRFFLQGAPRAILIIEFARESKEEILEITRQLESDMREAGFGYHFPLVFGPDIQRVWTLRKAGLGLMSNISGDAKPVALVEDTAVHPEVLPEYIEEFQQILEKHGLNAVYHAHIATGELHLRPVLNLKNPEHVELFHTVALETAKLVKKYRGSLSGEHGDGRLRGEFIPLMVGEKNFQLLRKIKVAWDSNHIFNPGKIVDTQSMKTRLRYEPGADTKDIESFFDFSRDHGIIRAVEKCNGSGDCRKTEIIGGTMCPSYMATRDENNTTRARANTLREFLSHSPKRNPFDHGEIYKVMDLCLSCKGCKSECPSSVDITKYKTEFLQHYYDEHGISMRTRTIAYISLLNKLSMLIPDVANFFFSNSYTSGILKQVLGFAPKRSIPLLYKFTLRNWMQRSLPGINPKSTSVGKVYLFIDEFTDYYDTGIGIKAVELLTRLGYTVALASHKESGRALISKGLLRKAKNIANYNVAALSGLISEKSPLIGIEPSGILTFRDEYPQLADQRFVEKAKELGKNALMFDEFFQREIFGGKINATCFSTEKKMIRLHGHCHQKSLASTMPTRVMLSLPVNFEVEEIRSGCCGMAGSFGYEKEHYEVSMKVGELVLFPEVRNTPVETLIAAPGTSCRHQIMDGTGRRAYHPVEIMWEALVR